MRRLFLFALLIITLYPVSASWSIGIDARCIDSFFIPAMRFDTEVSYSWDSIRVTVPLRFSTSFSYEFSFLESGLDIYVYPFEGYGFYVGVSMIHIGYAWGLEAPRESIIISSAISTGWTFTFPWFYFEPRLSVLDVFSHEEAHMQSLSEAIPQYSKLRLSLLAGIAIP